MKIPELILMLQQDLKKNPQWENYELTFCTAANTDLELLSVYDHKGKIVVNIGKNDYENSTS